MVDAMSSPVVWPVTSTKPTKSSCTVMVSRWRYESTVHYNIFTLHLYLHRDDGVPLDLEDGSNPGNFIEPLKFQMLAFFKFIIVLYHK